MINGEATTAPQQNILTRKYIHKWPKNVILDKITGEADKLKIHCIICFYLYFYYNISYFYLSIILMVELTLTSDILGISMKHSRVASSVQYVSLIWCCSTVYDACCFWLDYCKGKSSVLSFAKSTWSMMCLFFIWPCVLLLCLLFG